MSEHQSVPSVRQIKADRFLRAIDIGTLAVIAFPFLFVAADAALLEESDSDAIVFPMFALIGLFIYFICETYSIFMAFRLRNTDELTQAMWASGTNFAFFAAIFWLFIAVWIEAIWLASFPVPVADDVSGMTENSNSFVNDWASIVVLGAFFAGVQFKRLRG